MKTYKLVYNPYKVETKLFIVKPDGQQVAIGQDSSLAPVFHQRMQKWLAPSGSWKGFFAELKDVCGENQITLLFTGTTEDYQDLLKACKRYTPELHFLVDIRSTLNQASRMLIDGTYKLVQIQNLISNAREKADPAVLPEDVLDYLVKALDDSFEINVIAPVSSGKSTLQNALIGRRLLPTSNEAKTAVLTRTRINNGMSDFRAVSYLHDGTQQVHVEPVTQEFINALNDELDPSDPTRESALRDMICLEGPSEQFADCALDLVFVDTPGGNNAMNERHKAVMRQALFNENKNMILFVFSANTINHENTREAILEAAEAMKHGMNGQMSQDRFLFVCTSCDTIPDNLDATEKIIRQVLSSCGITEPNLFMVSALAVELMRMEEYNQKLIVNGQEDCCEPLTDKDENDLMHCLSNLSLSQCDLYAHASISSDLKETFAEEIGELKTALRERQQALKMAKMKKQYAQMYQLQDEINQISYRIALYNSGIPGLESAIRDYLNRYAIPMKIQQASLSIKAKAEAVEMRQKTAEKWASSEAVAKAAKVEAEARKQEMERSKELQKDKEKLDKLTLNKNSIISKAAACVRKLDTLPVCAVANAKEMTIGGKSGQWIKKSEADTYLATVNASLKRDMNGVIEDMTDYFNKEVVGTCNEIMNDYRRHIEAMRDKGMFDLAGMDVDKIIAAEPRMTETMDFDSIAQKHREITGTFPRAKRGFWNGLKRFFGVGGYESVQIYGDVDYVFVKDIFTTQRAALIQNFNSWVIDEMETLGNELSLLKEDVAKRMEKLDTFIQNLYNEYIEKLGDSTALLKEAQQWKAQTEWLNDFLQQVDALLEIEQEG